MVKTVFKTGGGKKAGDDFGVTFKQGEILFHEGDLGTEMFIIQEGRVAILKTIDGVETQLATLDKGDFFGEMSVLEDLPRTASAKAVTDSRLLQINGSTFDQMLRTNPEIAVRMMRKLARRLRETDKLLDEEKQLLSTGGRAHEVPPPASGPIRIAAPLLRLIELEMGHEFPLNAGEETLIGREDPVTGISPDVDMTEVDSQRSTSRRHAKLLRKGGQFFVVEEIGTTNGTFINGERAETGVPVELHAGDEVQFGLVKMLFKTD